MNLYIATLYYEALGTNYEYFTSLEAVEESLSHTNLFIRGTVSEYFLYKEEYIFNNKVWEIDKSNVGIKFIELYQWRRELKCCPL